jgi:hypothetical protein
MTGPDETLAAIDEAIEGWTGEDYSLSPDAMRWAPEPPEPRTTCWDPPPSRTPPRTFSPRAGRLYFAPAGTSLNAPINEWTEIGTALADGLEYSMDGPEADQEEGWQSVQESMTTAIVRVRAQWEGFVRAVAPLAKQFARASEATHVAVAPNIYGSEYRRHRRGCRVCNPAGNPKPLKVDGADYARRRKNRRRR